MTGDGGPQNPSAPNFLFQITSYLDPLPRTKYLLYRIESCSGLISYILWHRDTCSL